MSVDQTTLELFIETIRHLISDNNQKISLTKLPYVQSFNKTELTLSNIPIKTGLYKNNDGFILTLPLEGWSEILEFLRGLDGKGHKYIDYNDDIDLVISLDEYEDDWIGWKA